MAILDLGDIPLVDHHCHPFPRSSATIESSELASHFIFAGVAVMNLVDPILDEAALAEARWRLLDTSLVSGMVLRELASYLDCEPDWEAITAERNRRAAADHAGHVGGLLADAGIETLIIEDGPARPPIDPADFATYVPAKLRRVARLENHFRDKVEPGELTFDEIIADYDGWLDTETARGVVGFKSLIAYRTGLDVRVTTQAEARRSYETWRAGGRSDAMALKPMRDHLLLRAAGFVTEQRLWLHIHTGLGDADIAFDRSQPGRLYEFLKDDAVVRANVVLIHGGYPWVIDACSMAAVLPGVHVDLSSMTLFAAPNLVPYLRQSLEIAPASKIVYGSDGSVAETYWFAARQTRRALGRALGEYVDEGVLTAADALSTARLVLRENAQRMYDL